MGAVTRDQSVCGCTESPPGHSIAPEFLQARDGTLPCRAPFNPRHLRGFTAIRRCPFPQVSGPWRSSRYASIRLRSERIAVSVAALLSLVRACHSDARSCGEGCAERAAGNRLQFFRQSPETVETRELSFLILSRC